MGDIYFLIDDHPIHDGSAKNVQDPDIGMGSFNIDYSGGWIGVNFQEYPIVHFYANNPGEFNFTIEIHLTQPVIVHTG